MAQPCLLDLDQEQKNFFCLTMLINDVGNKSLREYFIKQWPIVYQNVKGTPPPAPWTNIPNDAAEMNNVEKRLMLEPKYEKPKFDTGDTEKWDFSLLSSVLLHSSLGFVNPSRREKSALENLKVVRNELVGHNTSSKIDDATFKSNWTKACNALKLFGATQADFTAVEDVLKKPSETLVPILKKIAATEEDIRDNILKFVQKIEENHKDVVEKMNYNQNELKRMIKEEVVQKIEENHKLVDEKMSHNQDELKRVIKEAGQSTLEERSEGQSSRLVLMAEEKRDLLQKLLPSFQNDFMATNLFDNLPCLTEEQKDQIAYDEKNYQTSKGVRTLVEKLEEHEEGFEQFVKALAKADLGHVAVKLDPDFKKLSSASHSDGGFPECKTEQPTEYSMSVPEDRTTGQTGRTLPSAMCTGAGTRQQSIITSPKFGELSEENQNRLIAQIQDEKKELGCNMAIPPEHERQNYKIRDLTRLMRENKMVKTIKWMKNYLQRGITGPLCDENKNVRDMGYPIRKKLTVHLCANEHCWKKLADYLGFSDVEICFLDNRYKNPADEVLKQWETKCNATVGDLYDILVYLDMPVIADIL